MLNLNRIPGNVRIRPTVNARLAHLDVGGHADHARDALEVFLGVALLTTTAKEPCQCHYAILDSNANIGGVNIWICSQLVIHILCDRGIPALITINIGAAGTQPPELTRRDRSNAIEFAGCRMAHRPALLSPAFRVRSEFQF